MHDKVYLSGWKAIEKAKKKIGYWTPYNYADKNRPMPKWYRKWPLLKKTQVLRYHRDVSTNRGTPMYRVAGCPKGTYIPECCLARRD